MADKPKVPHPQQGGLMFEIKPEVEGGTYSNVASIVHNKNEFVFDFAALLPGKDAARVQARVITNPAHAKQFLAALAENIANYERSFGEIAVPSPLPMVKGTQAVH
ncbi:MAG: DUF3467 domain-containing protein [Nitrospirae bacterium]|nr:DUF3467 domain-containing protein [Nitrospirota bacterium]